MSCYMIYFRIISFGRWISKPEKFVGVRALLKLSSRLAWWRRICGHLVTRDEW